MIPRPTPSSSGAQAARITRPTASPRPSYREIAPAASSLSNVETPPDGPRSPAACAVRFLTTLYQRQLRVWDFFRGFIKRDVKSQAALPSVSKAPEDGISRLPLPIFQRQAACYSSFCISVPSGILIWNWSSVSGTFSFTSSTERTISSSSSGRLMVTLDGNLLVPKSWYAE
jgi:hypothetical protein